MITHKWTLFGVSAPHFASRAGALALALALSSACAAGSDSETGAGGAGGGGQGGAFSCEPGKQSCENGKARLCNEDGTSAVEFECDATQGMVCQPGGCTGACSPFEIADSNIGCDYYPTVTPNPVWSGFSFAVAVVNTKGEKANVTVTRGAEMVATDAVDPGSLKVIKLPWVSELKGEDWSAPGAAPPSLGATKLVQGGAYRLRTDQPVAVYQFSPLEHEIKPAPSGCPLNNANGCFASSNDASLLLPSTAMSGDYTALAWPSHAPDNPGFITVTATANNTSVKVAGAGAAEPGAGIDAAGDGTLKMNAGDVLEIVAAKAPADMTAFGPDLSGTRVQGDKAIQVISGHLCGNVPSADTASCNHMEESMFPAGALGSDYFVTVPAGPTGDWPTVLRIAAVLPETTVHFDPPIADDTVLNPGGPPLEVTGVTDDVHITADKAILVGQYMVGSSVVGGTPGNPSLSLAAPTPQFRTGYLFLASSAYDLSFVNIIAKQGVTILLDGAAIPAGEFMPIGATDYAVARHALSNTDAHSISSTQPFGIVTYGYGDYASYMYPGGLDLAAINVAPAP